jgi:DNA-binding IclR family transcriptional regulator
LGEEGVVATPKNRSVLKAFALLQAFRGPHEYLTSAELSRRAGLPEASGYRLIQTLEAVGAVVRDSRGRYRPGFLLSTVTQQPSLAQALSEASEGVLAPLAERFGATAHVGILEHGMVTYVAKAASGVSVAVPTRVGAQQEAYCSAIGKVLLAALSEADLEGFLREGDLIPLTPRTITDPEVFRHEIRRVREAGFALDTGEAHAHLCCVAVPVRGAQGETLAALSIVDRIESLGDDGRAEARAALASAAEAISRKLPATSAGGVARWAANWSQSWALGVAEAAVGLWGGVGAAAAS